MSKSGKVKIMAQAQEKIEDTEESTVTGSQELIVWEELNPVELFKENGLDSVLKEIDEKARSVITEGVETKKSRDNIRAIAAKVGKDKTFIQKIGTKNTEEYRSLTKISNTERDRGVAFLQDLQDDIRKPLTEYEDAEKKRITDADQSIEKLSECAVFTELSNSNGIKLRIDQLVTLYQNRDFSDFSEADQEKYNNRAEHIYDRTRAMLDKNLQEQIQNESDQKELQELRESQAAQAKKDEEDRIRQDAADKATKDAEEKAKTERESSEKAAADKLAAEEEKTRRLEQDKKDAKDREDKAESDRITAEKKAEDDKKAAVQAEKDRVAADKKREANKKHTAKINEESAKALTEALPDIFLHQSEMIINVIAAGEVTNITISY